jgi:EAL domain-containing protein (putative c-di-GMP-specific phosphodiesterase class I)
LSAKQFAQPDLIGQVKKVLEDTGLGAEHVKLEITESVVMKNAEIATELLMQLCALGVHLSIDDFGTGYSSLSYLHRFPVTTLKIDRSFIGRMGHGGENSEIVRTINTLAHNLGMEVIAEGVETVEQLEQLKSMNCALGQGYLFSRPLDANMARAFIQERPTHVPAGIIGDGLIQSQFDLLN